MRTPRFHCPQAIHGLARGTRVELPPAAAHHALRVLRLADGDPIAVFSGHGGEYEAVLETARGKAAHARLDGFHAEDRAPQIDVHIQQAVVASEKMDWMIEKAVELGARSITPVLAERSVVRLSGERADRRVAHWQALAIAASEQCGMNRLLEVRPVCAMELACTQIPVPGSLCCLLSPEGECTLTEAVPAALHAAARAGHALSLTLLVGPEGGFSLRESAQAREHAYRALRLGPRVLRTETAALAALATVRAIADDFRTVPGPGPGRAFESCLPPAQPGATARAHTETP